MSNPYKDYKYREVDKTMLSIGERLLYNTAYVLFYLTFWQPLLEFFWQPVLNIISKLEILSNERTGLKK
jgi:hypothetical protein